MKIKFKRDCFFTVVESYDEKTDTTQESDESFKKGDIVDGDIVDDEGEYVSFQFGNGDMIYGLKKSLYKVIERD